MVYALKAVPEPQAILQAWLPFKQLIGVTSVHTEGDYAQARATIDALLDEVGDNESHPLADVLDYLADQVKAYEDENFLIPEAEPRKCYGSSWTSTDSIKRTWATVPHKAESQTS